MTLPFLTQIQSCHLMLQVGYIRHILKLNKLLLLIRIESRHLLLHTVQSTGALDTFKVDILSFIRLHNASDTKIIIKAFD